MKPKVDQWTVVLAGQWNIRIFSPGWVGRELFNDKKVQVEVGIGSGASNIRYLTQELVVIPADTMIVIGIKRIDDEVLKKAEELASRILNILPHTPVSGFGINFGYSIDTSETLHKLFKLNDLDALSAKGYEVRRTEILRSLKVDNQKLNLRYTLVADGTFEAHLNFHQDIDSANGASELLRERVLDCRTRGNTLMRDVYGLEVESEEKEESNVN